MRGQTDPKLNLQMNLKSYVFILELEIEAEAKAPGVCLSLLTEVVQFSDGMSRNADNKFINELKSQSVHDQF